MSATTRSLQFDGDGQIIVDGNGHPVYDRPPTGDLYLAMSVSLGTFHADPDLGSLLPSFVAGRAREASEIRAAIEDGLQRLVDLGTLTVDDVLIFDAEALVYTSATDQPFEVSL